MNDRAYRTAPAERFSGGHHRPPIEGMEYRAPLGRSLAILLALGVIGWAAIAALIAGVMS